MSFVDRLMEFRLPNETKRQFCIRLGINRSLLRMWELGTPEKPVEPRISTLVTLSERLGVRVGWLATGEEPKLT